MCILWLYKCAGVITQHVIWISRLRVRYMSYSVAKYRYVALQFAYHNMYAHYLQTNY